MGASYKKLWKLLIDRDLLKRDLREKANISPSTMAKLGRGESVNMDILLRICKALDCDIADIVEVVLDEPEQTEATTMRATEGKPNGI
jgi:DNA-binding Xre family transcriptional regulator